MADIGYSLEALGQSASTHAAAESGGGGSGSNHVLEFEQPLYKLETRILEHQALQRGNKADHSKALQQLRARHAALLKKTYANLSAWETVQVARHPRRPQFRDYVQMICRDFRELHGDRHFGDDSAIVCGLARLDGHKVMLLGHHKGRETREKIKCCWGMAHPEGYRKALRCMKLAEKYGLPVVTLIDTLGAYPGIGAEERGQARSIAVNLMEMSRLRTPIISIVCGEGGSGGALGIGIADSAAMMEFAWYAVISPEACSAILFKGADGAEQIAGNLRLTSRELKQLGVIDAVIAEPPGAAHRDPNRAAQNLGKFIADSLRELKNCTIDELMRRRYARYRGQGVILERRVAAAPAE